MTDTTTTTSTPHIIVNAPWFGALVTRRRQMLGMYRSQIPRVGGPAVATTVKIEDGRGTTTCFALSRLDRALQWDVGTSESVLAGGENGAAARSVDTSLHDVAIRSRPPITAVDTKTPARVRPRTQERAKRTRRKILFGVARTIARHGSSGSINKILAGADVTKGAMYFHFDSKDAVVHAMLEEAATMSSALRSPAPRDESVDAADTAAAMVGGFLVRARETPLVHAETVLWNDPDYALIARKGTYSALRADLIDTLTGTLPDATLSVDAIMAVLCGIVTVPGEQHGLADPAVVETVQRLIALILHPER